MLLALTSLGAFAQKIVGVRQQDNKIVIEYDLNKPAESVSVYVSEDGGKNYRGPLSHVTGDLNQVPAGSKHSITWDVLREYTSFQGNNIKFKLSIKEKEKYFKQAFFTFNGAHSTAPQNSIGFSFGQVKHFGWFISVMSNGSFTGMGLSRKCDDLGFLEDGHLPMYTGTTSTDRISAMAGIMIRLAGPLCAKVGAGYGVRNLCWETVDGNWCLNKEHSQQGVDACAGLQANFRGFAISVEAVTTSFETIEGKVGIGFAFRKKK